MNDARGLRQCERLGFALLLLVGIDHGGRFDVVLLKEPLSFLARRSALAVVHPVDRVGHCKTPSYFKKSSRQGAKTPRRIRPKNTQDPAITPFAALRLCVSFWRRAAP
jgi:hypothetical protein